MYGSRLFLERLGLASLAELPESRHPCCPMSMLIDDLGEELLDDPRFAKLGTDGESTRWTPRRKSSRTLTRAAPKTTEGNIMGTASRDGKPGQGSDRGKGRGKPQKAGAGKAGAGKAGAGKPGRPARAGGAGQHAAKRKPHRKDSQPDVATGARPTQ